MKRIWIAHTMLAGIEAMIPSGRLARWFLRKTKHGQLQDSHCASERLSQINKYLSSLRLFIAALFSIASNWKQPRCPSVGK